MKSSLALLVIFVLGLALSACHPPPRPPRPPHPRGEMMKEKKMQQIQENQYRLERINTQKYV